MHDNPFLIYNRCALAVTLSLLLGFSLQVEAQSMSRFRGYKRPGSAALSDNAKTHSLVISVMHQLDSLQWYVHHTNLADSLSNPYLVSLVSRPSLYQQSVSRLFSLPKTGRRVGGGGNASAASTYFVDCADRLVVAACLQYPQWVVPPTKGTQVATKSAPIQQPEVVLTEQYQAPPTLPESFMSAMDDNLGIVVRKPNFWTWKANFTLQFTQNYVSDNWYKGGESHNALLASTVIEANYNNQQKLTFDNKLEMKLGFQSSYNDEEHKYKTNSDLLRLTNKLGLRAVKNWYYTLMLQSWTQFYKGYKANDSFVYSDFMSPFESLLSIGMDYQCTTKNKKFKINATLSPIALKLKHVSRSSLVTKFGISEGHHVKWEYGSNVTINYTWQLVKNVSWTGRIYYFTDYSSTQLEWENTFDLSINRYLSARVFLYPRFDDSRSRSEGQSDFEFKELLSLGLNVSF